MVFNVEKAKALLIWAADAQFLAAFLIFAGVSLMGAVVASAQAILETFLLDCITPKLVGITRAEFQDEWNEYVKALPESRNPYISRVVLFFQFETRMGLSLVVLGMFLLKLSYAHAGVAASSGLILYAVGLLHHKELGDYRHLCYGKKRKAPNRVTGGL